MPELPEVETIAQRLNQVLPGKRIVKVSIPAARSFVGDATTLPGLQILTITRRAKILQFSLDNGSFLLIHLKMTGQLIFTDGTTRVGGGHPTDDWVKSLPSAHTRVQFTFEDGSHLFFNDQRLFGWIKLVDESGLTTEFKNYAYDVIDERITPDIFFAKTQRTSRPIKVVVMDNTIMSGVGNIYACDALNVAQIHPSRPAHSLTHDEASKVLAAAKQVIALGIQLGGATIEHFRHVDGFSGNYQDEVRVYGREGAHCRNCGGSIQKYKLAGRGTYWCPDCQR